MDRLDRGLRDAADTQHTIADDLELWARLAATGSDGDTPADVMFLAQEVRSRLGDLETQQQTLIAELADDRRRLIAGAVNEIRTLLFGQ